MKVLVVGAGMYVCGKNTKGLGTIVPTLIQCQKQNLIGEILIAATSKSSCDQAKIKISECENLMGHKSNISFFPSTGIDELAYLKAAELCQAGDIAIISTPDETHFSIAQDLIKKGLHLLVVKPLAPTLNEVKLLTDMAKEYGCYGAVEFHKRFDRSNLKLKEYAHSKIGDILYFVVEYSQRKEIPEINFRSWAESTNIFQYLGIHYVDVIYFATGAVPIRAMATGQKNYLSQKGINSFDAIQATIEWQLNNKVFVSTIITNWIDPQNSTAMSDQRIKVIGTTGRFEADQKDRGLFFVSDDQKSENINPDFCQFYLNSDGTKTIEGYGVESIKTFIFDVHNINQKKISLAQLERQRPTFSHSNIPVAVVEAVNQSLLEKSSWIEIKL
jgi:predicted dehydrogenase